MTVSSLASPLPGSVLLAVALGAALTGWAAHRSTRPETEVAGGLPVPALFVKTCAGCHAPDVEGVPGRGPSLVGSPLLGDPGRGVSYLRRGRDGAPHPADVATFGDARLRVLLEHARGLAEDAP